MDTNPLKEPFWGGEISVKFDRKTTVGILLCVSFLMFLPAAVHSYSNDNRERTMSGGPHRVINAFAVQAFVAESLGDPVLTQYDFWGGESLTGITVVQPGNWEEDVQEGIGEGKWYQWVIEGGYTADEPERYMSLRHFYDPLGANQGATYLTDHVEEWLTSFVMGPNPKMDAKWWGALHSPYSLTKGVEFMERAFSASRSQEKERLFAAAWRSLGETMHLLADMTVPAHVRNDSHPGVAWTEYITDKYRADPYEEYVDEGVAKDSMAEGRVDPDVLREIQSIPETQRGLLKVLQLFDLVAACTNRNYFSLDTIAGTERISGRRFTNANSMPEYPSPRLEDLEVDKEQGYYYREDFLGRVRLVRVVRDGLLQKLAELGAVSLSPRLEIDRNCSFDQAKRLVPAAVAVGQKLLGWFMPRVEVILDSFVVEEKEGENIGLLKGRIVHTPFGVYDDPLSFTLPEDGNVTVVVDGESVEPPLGTVSIKEGVIEGRIPLASRSPVKEIDLVLDIGGIRVSSSAFTVPFLELHPENLSGLAGEKYGFYVVVENCPPQVVYLWDFGDGSVTETGGTSLSHVYAKEGEYHLRVTMQDPGTKSILAIARGKAYILPAQAETTPKEGPLTPDLSPPVEDEKAHRQRILAEYRLLYPEFLPWFYNYKGRIELIANAEEVGPDLYRVAYKLWQVVEEGPRKGEEYVAAYLDLNCTLEQLEADLALMKKKLGKE